MPAEDALLRAHEERMAAFSAPGFQSQRPARRAHFPPGISPTFRQARDDSARQLFGPEPRELQSEVPMPGLGVLPSPPKPSVLERVEVTSPAEPTKPPAAVRNKVERSNLRSANAKAPTPQRSTVLASEDMNEFPALPTAAPSKAVKNKASAPKTSAHDPKSKTTGKATEKTLSTEQTRDARANRGKEPTAGLDAGSQHSTKLEIAASEDFETKDDKIDTTATSKKASVQNSDQSTTTSTNFQLPTPSGIVQPRTIRVLPTTKGEAPPPAAAAPTTSAKEPLQGSTSELEKRPSRQSSVTSLNIPGTPSSERAHDNMSSTPDSVSRPSSPPAPAKAERAATGPKAKSIPRTEKSEKSKAIEDKKDIGSAASPSNETVIQEPIVGRKKKTKKPAAQPTSNSTPDLSRPASPALQDKNDAQESVEVEEVTPILSGEASVEPQDTHEDPPTESAPPQAVPIPANVISSLRASGTVSPSQNDFFRASMNLFSTRHEVHIDDLPDAVTPTPLSSSEISSLDAGEPVRRAGDDGRASSRLLITPNRRCLSRLTPEMEDRYLEIEKAVMASRVPEKYVHQRSDATQMLTSVDDILKDMCAALTRPPTTTAAATTGTGNTNYPLQSNTGTTISGEASATGLPAYADDALTYLNQYILPPLPARGNKAGDSVSKQPAIGSAIPRTYTTGDPTYSVSGIDANTGSSVVPNLSPPTVTSTSIGKTASSNGAVIQDADPLAGGGTESTGSFAIKQALANAMNGVVQAAAAVAGVNTGSLGHSAHGFGGLVSAEEAEQALQASRKECEALEKKLAALVRKNRRLAGLQ